MIPNKKKEQHIMIIPEINKKVIEIAEITKNDNVLEIGGGPGNLTELIMKKAKFVYTVEKDEEYCSELKKRFLAQKNVEIICEDILNVKLPIFNKIVANPPYQILQQFFIRLLIKNRENFECCGMIIPNKFTKIITRLPEENNFGLLSALFYVFYNVEIISTVPKESFSPMPKVTSYLVKITMKKSEDSGIKLLKKIFLQYNKKIGNIMLSFLWNNMYDNKYLTKKEAKIRIEKLRQKDTIKKIFEKNILRLSDNETRELILLILTDDEFCKNIS